MQMEASSGVLYGVIFFSKAFGSAVGAPRRQVFLGSFTPHIARFVL